ncbi:tyrosine-type recombinase/integrase [Roseovarius aestuariivivens]|uniref:tyrosine-type recombinase/integrase n=1 Tax=Roseovarius aestuariivivens TaxID=1888910 RepID=UPI00315B0205
MKAARDEADKWRAVVREGKDAIKERERQRPEAEQNLHILSDIAHDAFESRKAELKGDDKAGRWFPPLELHVLPKLEKMSVSQIDQSGIRDTLAPILQEKADTARKAMNRLSICLRHAAALGLNVDLRATDKAKALLGKQLHTVKNFPAMNWRNVPAFYQSLDGSSVCELVLRLLILTAVRSFPLRHLRLSQINGNIWTIPAEAMKGRVGATSDFRAPLSQEA